MNDDSNVDFLRNEGEFAKGDGVPETGARFCKVADELERLQAIVAALPKCNRLLDGKLVCDKPVVPGMAVWYYDDVGYLRSGKAVVFVEDTLASILVADGWVRLDECFDTPEAAQAAGGE